MTIRVAGADLRVLPMRTRMPFRYGIATLTELPHLFVRLDVVVDGTTCSGIAADGLAPKWFTKNPVTTAGEDIADMLRVVEAACKLACSAGPATTVFELWREVYAAQSVWAAPLGYPPLLWAFGVSLVERALIDAFCRARGTSFARALRDNSFGLQLHELHAELQGEPAEWLPPRPRTSIIVRHTVGLSDPITDREIAPAEQVDDGLPRSLEASIRAYGLTHFKVKLSGDATGDRERLGRIAAVLEQHAPGYAVTLDGNEQFHDLAAFREQWRLLAEERTLTPLLRRVLFVEQPLHRDVALGDDTARVMREWPARPPIIIDESDGEIGSLGLALSLGYAGASHKNCKGVFKGVANACLVAQRRRDGTQCIQSGEDLANVGPVALLQDLAVMASLGIEHVERNGHHYFAGLSMFETGVGERVLERHADLYRRHDRGWPTLRIRHGTVSLGSVAAAPFGLDFAFDSGGYVAAAG